MTSSPEFCHWITLKDLDQCEFEGQRVYIGHETCEKHLPTLSDITRLNTACHNQKLLLTLVTPALTPNGFENTIALLEELRQSGIELEVVTADWGLLYFLSNLDLATPIVSRILVGQLLDFRLNDLIDNKLSDRVVSIDDKLHVVHQKPLSQALLERLERPSLLSRDTIQIFNELGVSRFELSNVFWPLSIPQGLDCSLHVPYVPLSIMKTCPADGYDFNHVVCAGKNCTPHWVEWQDTSHQTEIFKIDNALYYKNTEWKSKVKSAPNINRIIFKNF